MQFGFKEYFTIIAVLLSALPSSVLAKGTISGKVSIVSKARAEKEASSDVVVFIEEVPSFDSGLSTPKSAKISMSHKAFIPNVLPVLKGTTVAFPNQDIVMHNVFSLSKLKPFDLGLYGAGDEKSVTFPQSGLTKIYCNIHEEMVGYILILDNPYFTVTDSSGRFKIPNVPSGNYTLTAWSSHSKSQSRPVQIRDKGKESQTELNFKLAEEGHNRGHLNKWGKAYKEGAY